MYPHVIQPETRRYEAEAAAQLVRERAAATAEHTPRRARRGLLAVLLRRPVEACTP